MFVTNKRFVSFFLILFAFLVFFSLSSVSAQTYNFNSNNTTSDFQNVIDHDTDSDLVINLADGNYTFNQINISRNATIKGNSKGNVKITGPGTGTLFNITSTNVRIVNLTIGGFDTAIKSNKGDLVIADNNIASSSMVIDIQSEGVYLKRINIENNTINCPISDYLSFGIYIDVSGISNNADIIITNNNMIGDLSDFVRIYFEYINNITVIFENNNINGNRYIPEGGDGFSLSTFGGNNNSYIFLNNNINVFGTALYFYQDMINNTNVILANNNLTGDYEGICFDMYFVENLTMLLTNNYIMATNLGVDFEGYDDFNNVDIKFVNNNITGEYGVDIYPKQSTNFNISFINNNITGDYYGVYIYTYPSIFSGLKFLNNVINSPFGDGFHFSYYDEGPFDVSDIVISGNTIFAPNGAGLNFTDLYVGDRVNVTVEYNRILALVGVNITGFNDNSSFDYNWWGVNDISGLIFGIDTNNHYILSSTNFTSSYDPIFGDIVGVMFLVLNNTFTNEGVGYLPYFVVNGTFNGQDFVVNTTSNFTYKFNITSVGSQLINGTLDNQNLSFEFYANKSETHTSIIVSNATVGKKTIVHGIFVDKNNNPIVGAQLTIIIEGSIYKVFTGSNGNWSLSYIPLKEGKFTAIAHYIGNDNYTYSINRANYTVSKNPPKTDIRLYKRFTSKSVSHGNIVYVKTLNFKNYGGSGSQTLNTQVVYKNLKYKLWKVYNKKLKYHYANNKIKFNISLKSGKTFKLKLKVYRPIR